MVGPFVFVDQFGPAQLALGDIPGQRVHALAIRAFAPGEAE
jgi:hypothetical protein